MVLRLARSTQYTPALSPEWQFPFPSQKVNGPSTIRQRHGPGVSGLPGSSHRATVGLDAQTDPTANTAHASSRFIGVDRPQVTYGDVLSDVGITNSMTSSFDS